MLDKLDRVISVDSDVGPQDMVQEILDLVGSMDERIVTTRFRENEPLQITFSKWTTLRQVVPGQFTLSDPYLVPPDKKVSFNTDLGWGNSESISKSIKQQLTLALTFDYIKAHFIVRGEPIYQGGGLYAIQWGLMVVIAVI